MVRSLCEEIVSRPAFQEYREIIGAFMEDEEAVSLLQAAREIQREQRGRGDGETAGGFASEEEREAVNRVMANERAVRFLAAQEDLKNTEAVLHLFITRTLELGRVPDEDELLPEEGGCCGGECECGEGRECENDKCGCA